jgi:hypothetical protein
MNMKIFISYSNEDSKKLKSLSEALRHSTKKFRPIIIEKRKDPGKPLSEKVKAGIQETPFFISMLTRSSITNQWVNQELGFAIGDDRNIYPIVETSIVNNLKGFIHNQIDLPFQFEGNPTDSQKEAQSFRKCCQELIRHLEQLTFRSSISPKKVKQGDPYTTKVCFIGKAKNAFFTNYVLHTDSNWSIWHWDTSTLRDNRASSPGELHGEIRKESQYVYRTDGWPIGKYKICTRVYEHPVPGETRRFILFEKVHNFEVVSNNP